MKQYMTNAINSSPTITIAAGADMTQPGGKAVKFSDGKAVLCSTAGERPIGIVTIDNDAEVKTDDIISVQVKDIGVALMGGAVAAGDELAVDANGALVKAAAGQYVAAVALASCASGEFGTVQLVSYKNGTVGGGA